MACPFCDIATKKTPAKILHEDGFTVTFEDASPKAPVHLLIVPKKHIGSIDELKADDGPLMGRVLLEAARAAREKKVTEHGYRVVINMGRAAGQSVSHLHVHVLGGRGFSWPPG